MGVYDSVLFNCPFCGEELDIQSKAGDCNLDTYKINKVPLIIAGSIQNTPIFCPTCNKELQLVTDQGDFVRMSIIVK